MVGLWIRLFQGYQGWRQQLDVSLQRAFGVHAHLQTCCGTRHVIQYVMVCCAVLCWGMLYCTGYTTCGNGGD